MELLFIFVVIMAVVTVLGHAIWIAIAAAVRWFVVDDEGSTAKPDRAATQLDDLAITERQIIRFYAFGKLSDQTYQELLDLLRAERTSVAPKVEIPTPVVNLSVVKPPVPVPAQPIAPAPPPLEKPRAVMPAPRVVHKEQKPVAPPKTARPPRRSFSEVLNSFMEESNIRWGEIIGGLLIIGCSTALVVSLWAQISQIPVLKFLIFTTVTAVLFGIGLYTEHRWKLPTTSRGILTIATLLVPLNFLAIAAVSISNTSGALVIGSELAAPAIFLCLVYFAGRIITPGCAHILSAGVLGSSIGQLLVRHFASLDASPVLLIFLGAFPVACYVATVGLALRLVLRDREIDESEVTTVFTVLGTMSFAALLPFGLLLYRSGPMSMSMMYLAPIVTLWGLPMLATGTILWKRITNKELVASRTAGTALGILGLAIVLAGMFLAWPNPASIVPAALLNFAILTALAVALRLPVAHLIATACFALAYLVTFHVFAGNVTWVNLRVMSLLQASLSVSSGQALVGAFALLLIASEWLARRKRKRDGDYYLIAACFIAHVSLTSTTVFTLASHEYHALWIVYGLYAIGAFWIAWRRHMVSFAWVGSALLLFSMVHSFANVLSFSFPWQTALFAHATICTIAAIVCSRHKHGEVFQTALNYSALMTLVLGVISLFQTNPWQVTWMQVQRVSWIAAILLLSLWLNRLRFIFHAFQIAVVGALILSVKAALQEHDWYSYLPHAFMHPTALQIQGTVLVLFCLVWVSLRLFVRSALQKDGSKSWLTAASRLLDTNYSIDRLLVWVLLGGLVLLAAYGSLSGVTQELAAMGSGYQGYDIAGFPHREALALGSWIVLGLLTITFLGSFWERRKSIYLLGALTAVSTMVPLLAGRFEDQIATATAWRWLAALFLLIGSFVIWKRREVSQALRKFGWPEFDLDSKYARTLLIVLTVVPLMLLTIYPTLRAIYYLPVQGPTSGLFSLFADEFSYGAPLVFVAAIMIGYALRERLPRFAFYAGALLNTTVTLVFLLSVVATGGLMDRVVLIRLVQLNAMTFAVFSLPWLSTRHLWRSVLNEAEFRFAHYLLKSQLAFAIGLHAVLFAPVLFALVNMPEFPGLESPHAGSVLGWLSFATIVIATLWMAASKIIKPSADALAAVLLGVCCLIAFSVSGIDGWLGLHVLTVCVVLAAWLMVAASEFRRAGNWQSQSRQMAVAFGVMGLFLSLRSLADTGMSRWWSVAPLLGITALAATLNWKTQRRRYIYIAAILFNLAVSVWLIYISPAFIGVSEFGLINLIAGSLAAILWLWLELRARRLRQSDSTLDTAFSFHNVAAILSIVSLALFVLASFLVEPIRSPVLLNFDLVRVAFASILALIVACLWDRHARYTVVGLYILGLIAVAITIQTIDFARGHAWTIAMLLTAYTLFTAFLWRRRNEIIDIARQIGIMPRLDREASELHWFSAFSVLAITAIGVLAFAINVTAVDFELRVETALAFLAQTLLLIVLAEGKWKEGWQRAALAVFVIGVVLFGWSWLTPRVNATWLNRSVILMVVTFGVTAFYGLLLDKVKARLPEWTNAARACVPWLLGAGVVALLFCLQTEIFYQLAFGAVRIHPVSLIAIGATLIAAVVIPVLFALSEKHDPLSLSERGRMGYVYAAEVMLALLFLHVRLTMPWLFTGFIERHWPLVVMAIAFFGVIASEALRRRQLLVLAKPLERTGVFLPLLPVLAFWLLSSEVDFSLFLFVVGALYGLLSILRRSFVFGALAAAAGNAGLWYVFHRTDDYQFFQHPQLWLIPVALSVLAAAHLNEEKLSEDQMTGVRYLSLVTIYVSSTADIFINGVANSPWLPLILGMFSLAGVFAGILFRIRGLLMLGSIFLLLSIVTMICYASVNFGWTWLWYVAGIVTGATIIFMFAVFEKKRSEVLRVVDGLRDWDR